MFNQIELAYPKEYPQCRDCKARQFVIDGMVKELSDEGKLVEETLVESLTECLPDNAWHSQMSVIVRAYLPILKKNGSLTHSLRKASITRTKRQRVECPGLSLK